MVITCNLVVMAVIFFPFYRFFIHDTRKRTGKKDPARDQKGVLRTCLDTAVALGEGHAL